MALPERRRPLLLLGLAFASVLALAGCGSSGDAGGEHLGHAGEGHLHLYVDGAKHTRLYGSWFHLDGLAPGAHALRVEAVANNHAPTTTAANRCSPRRPSRRGERGARQRGRLPVRTVG